VLAAAAWSQQGIPGISPETPLGGSVIPQRDPTKVTGHTGAIGWPALPRSGAGES
jgi:hypothetical protein